MEGDPGRLRRVLITSVRGTPWRRRAVQVAIAVSADWRPGQPRRCDGAPLGQRRRQPRTRERQPCAHLPACSRKGAGRIKRRCVGRPSRRVEATARRVPQCHLVSHAASLLPRPRSTSYWHSTPTAECRWTLARSGPVSLPSWNSPDGFRIAYLSGSSLRVVNGDGSGDHLLAKSVAKVAPAWMPGPAYVLAYAGKDGGVTAVAADSGREVFTTRRSSAPIGLQWSTDGKRLLVVRSSAAEVYDPEGHLLWRRSAPSHAQRSPMPGFLPMGIRSRSSPGPTLPQDGASFFSPEPPELGLSSPGLAASATSPGRPTVVGCFSAGKARTSGSSSVQPSRSGSLLSPIFRASSRLGPTARVRPSLESRVGAARR